MNYTLEEFHLSRWNDFSFAPPGLDLFHLSTTACAVGCILAPLRGWDWVEASQGRYYHPVCERPASEQGMRGSAHSHRLAAGCGQAS